MSIRPGLQIAITLLGLASVTSAQNWPQFRGPARDGKSTEQGLLRAWPEGGPEVLWTVEACQGYSAPAIFDGKVYFNDYDRETSTWHVRCLDLETGEELWRFGEKRKIRPNHGITRSIPAVDGEFVFSIDPKCVLHCLSAADGKELWRKSLVSEYGTRIPSWYNGQCPLIEPDRLIVAVGGEALIVALTKDTGEELWRTPNPEKWPLSHASIMPAELGGVSQYLYCTLKGPLGISTEDGALLWHHPFKLNVAVPTSPLVVGDSHVFITSGYDAGSLMVDVRKEGDAFKTEEVFRFSSAQWNSEVQTPIVHDGHIFGVGKKRRGLFTCMNPEGEIVWTSEGEASFGMGSYMYADGMFLVLEGPTGVLRLLEASTTGYKELASAELLSGPDVWGPPALSGGKLLVRDMQRLICLRVGVEASGG